MTLSRRGFLARLTASAVVVPYMGSYLTDEECVANASGPGPAPKPSPRVYGETKITAADVPEKMREVCMAHYGQPTEPAWVWPKHSAFRWFDQTFVTEDGETWREGEE